MKFDKHQEILTAALLHDVGKALQRTGISPESMGARDYDFQNILPARKRDGGYTHLHALFTFLFLSQMQAEGYLPSFSEFGGRDENIILLAARHHKPSSVYDTIVSEADWISSGMDRKQYDAVVEEPPTADHHITERLSPVFEEVSLRKNKFTAFSMRYPLKCFSPEAIFPIPMAGEDKRPRDQAAAEYRLLFDHFTSGFKRIGHFLQFSNYLESLVSLLEESFWSVPSATYSAGRKAWSDISLYDHSVTTAALAHSLLLYHEETKTLTESDIRNRSLNKFLFINIDVSGIQRFIFDITVDAARGAARMLRARSFYLGLLMEGVFRILCKELGLFTVHRLVDAGGRALVLAPNLAETEERLKTIQDQVDLFCLKNFNAELTVNLSWLPASGHDLEMDRFDGFLTALNEKAQEAKLHKLSGLIGKKESHRLEKFWTDYQPGKGLCHVCQKMQAAVSDSDRHDHFICSWCRRFAILGSRIAHGNFIAYQGDEDRHDAIPVPGGCFEISRQAPQETQWSLIWDISRSAATPFARKPIPNAIPLYHDGDPVNPLLTDPGYNSSELINDAIKGIAQGAPKTFHHIALSSLRLKAGGNKYEGRPYLAVFKADVDNLGMLFGYGLRGDDGKGNRLTIGRYATFSRMMDRFFSAYLPHLFASNPDFADTYTVFAGGDDLFIIGPWTRTFLLAKRIYDDFRRYTCRNPDITLSGTLNLMKSRHPVNYIAHVAEAGLHLAKNRSLAKDSFHIWDEVLPWSVFPLLVDTKERLDGLMNDPKSKVSRGLVYDFLTLKEMKRRFESRLSLQCGAYISLFRYKLGRLRKNNAPESAVDELTRLFGNYVEGDEPLHIAIQWAVYLNRR
ncbi:MAG: type III-A CRISPR-associated protein Cas10/Csm1 [Pseudomonadota bacterium]|nr:type III-A CRISPR-associated protein Cas10/Csm1 [Pseudomonadota bacterium]